MPWLQPVTLRSASTSTSSRWPSAIATTWLRSVKDGALWTLWYTSVPPPEEHAGGDRTALCRAGGGLDAAVRA